MTGGGRSDEGAGLGPLAARLAAWRSEHGDARPRTRFAPAPTGYLHLGHVANAVYVWGIAAAVGASVVLRIEDHDRVRCRPEYEAALLDDLGWLGFAPDEPAVATLRTTEPSAYRQSDNGTEYQSALDRLDSAGLAYACDCARSTYDAWAATTGAPFHGPGCPGDCRSRDLRIGSGLGIRVAIGAGLEAFDDLALGARSGHPSAGGDLLARDRDGNWTYVFAVVVDDLRHGIDLVVRGEDLLDDTPRQIRLGRLLGRTTPPAFLHHPLIRKPGGAKLSKADGDTSIRDLRAGGVTADELIGRAAAAVGLLVDPGLVAGTAVGRLFA